MTGGCPAIPAMLGLFNKLVNSGFKVILLTGRGEETLGQVTIENLHNQGFLGYERLILRSVYTHNSCMYAFLQQNNDLNQPQNKTNKQ